MQALCHQTMSTLEADVVMPCPGDGQFTCDKTITIKAPAQDGSAPNVTYNVSTSDQEVTCAGRHTSIVSGILKMSARPKTSVWNTSKRHFRML